LCGQFVAANGSKTTQHTGNKFLSACHGINVASATATATAAAVGGGVISKGLF
jgi:hypothetical protein